jgi:hypothetical protein
LATLRRRLSGCNVGYIDGTHDHGLDFAPTVKEHAHPMSSRLIASTVVGQNKRKIHGMFICIRHEVPLLLRLIVDFMCAGADAAELRKK